MKADIKTREYKTVKEVAGPLMVVEGVEGVAFGEVVKIRTGSGEERTGQVLESRKGLSIIQVFEGTAGIDTRDTTVRFIGDTMKLAVSRDMVGRFF